MECHVRVFKNTAQSWRFSHLTIQTGDQVVELTDAKLQSQLKKWKSHGGPVGRLVLAKEFWRGWNNGRTEAAVCVCVRVKKQSCNQSCSEFSCC